MSLGGLVAATPFEHGPAIRSALRAIVSDPAHGSDSLDDGRVIANLLQDLLPGAPREAGLVGAATGAGIPRLLRSYAAQGLDAATSISLAAAALAGRTAFSAGVCRWVTTELAIALDMTGADDAPFAHEPTAPAPGPAMKVRDQAGPGQVARYDRLRGLATTTAPGTDAGGLATSPLDARSPAPGRSDVTAVACTWDGSAFAVGDSEGRAYRCDAVTAQILEDLTPRLPNRHSAPRGIESIAYSPGGSALAVGCADGSVLLGNMPSGSWHTLRVPDSVAANSVAFSPDGQRLACGDENGTVCLWNVSTLEVARIVAAAGSGGVCSVAFSPDGTRLAAGGFQGIAYLWDPETWRLVATPARTGAEEMVCVAFASDGTVLATADGSGDIALWDAMDGTRISVLRRRRHGRGRVFSLAFSPRTLELAAGYSFGGALWDAERGRVIMTFQEVAKLAVFALAFSPDGDRLVTGHSDGTAGLWDLTTGRLIMIAIDPGGIAGEL